MGVPPPSRCPAPRSRAFVASCLNAMTFVETSRCKRDASCVMRPSSCIRRIAFCVLLPVMKSVLQSLMDGTPLRQDRWTPEMNAAVRVLVEPSARRFVNRRDPVELHHTPGWFGITSTTEVKLAAANCPSDQVRSAYDHSKTRCSLRGRPVCPAGGCIRPGMAHPPMLRHETTDDVC